ARRLGRGGEQPTTAPFARTDRLLAFLAGDGGEQDRIALAPSGAIMYCAHSTKLSGGNVCECSVTAWPRLWPPPSFAPRLRRRKRRRNCAFKRASRPRA